MHGKLHRSSCRHQMSPQNISSNIFKLFFYIPCPYYCICSCKRPSKGPSTLAALDSTLRFVSVSADAASMSAVSPDSCSTGKRPTPGAQKQRRLFTYIIHDPMVLNQRDEAFYLYLCSFECVVFFWKVLGHVWTIALPFTNPLFLCDHIVWATKETIR